MNLSLTSFFNLRLAHIAPLGYARAVSFTQPSWNVPPAPPNQSDAGMRSLGEGRSVQAVRQLHRVHYKADCELTPAELRKRIARQTYQTKKQAKRRSPEFFQQAKAQLTQQAFALEGES